MTFKDLLFKGKNNKFNYYTRNYFRRLLPTVFYQKRLKPKLNTLKNFDEAAILKRVDYYNKLNATVELTSARALASLKNLKKNKTYVFDLQEYGRYFNQQLRVNFLPGDITQVPDEPALVKSRPISDSNSNAVLLKLNKVRHFIFVEDQKKLSEKRNTLVWRGKVHITQPQRIRFMEMYASHPLCNVGKTNENTLPKEWVKDKMTLAEQLEYKFILSLEGNDVASNLKWVMSSNSIAIMPKPRFETWFMEGLLIPDYHYIEIKKDYSNLEEKLNYYIQRPDEALQIVKNANAFVAQFKHQDSEDLVSLLVLKKYFERTGQL